MTKPARAFALLGAAAAGIAAVAIVVFSYAYRRGETFAAGSSWRATPEGLKAFALLLESQGYRVDRLVDPWDLEGSTGLFVSVAGHHEPGAKKGGG